MQEGGVALGEGVGDAAGDAGCDAPVGGDEVVGEVGGGEGCVGWDDEEEVPGDVEEHVLGEGSGRDDPAEDVGGDEGFAGRLGEGGEVRWDGCVWGEGEQVDGC